MNCGSIFGQWVYNCTERNSATQPWPFPCLPLPFQCNLQTRLWFYKQKVPDRHPKCTISYLVILKQSTLDDLLLTDYIVRTFFSDCEALSNSMLGIQCHCLVSVHNVGKKETEV